MDTVTVTATTTATAAQPNMAGVRQWLATAVSGGNLPAAAAAIGCPVQLATYQLPAAAGDEPTTHTRKGVRKWQLEAALWNHFGGLPRVDISAGFKACDSVTHTAMVGPVEKVAKGAYGPCDTHLAKGGRDKNASRWYFASDDRGDAPAGATGGFAAGPKADKALDKAYAELGKATMEGDEAAVLLAKAAVEAAKQPKVSKVQSLEAKLAAALERLAALEAQQAK